MVNSVGAGNTWTHKSNIGKIPITISINRRPGTISITVAIWTSRRRPFCRRCAVTTSMWILFTETSTSPDSFQWTFRTARYASWSGTNSTRWGVLLIYYWAYASAFWTWYASRRQSFLGTRTQTPAQAPTYTPCSSFKAPAWTPMLKIQRLNYGKVIN